MPQADAARRLCEWVLALLRLYSEHNLGLVPVAPGAALAGEQSAERCRGLRALLRLLTHLTARDLLDYGTQPGQAPVDVAQVRLLGLWVSPKTLNPPRWLRL